MSSARSQLILSLALVSALTTAPLLTACQSSTANDQGSEPTTEAPADPTSEDEPSSDSRPAAGDTGNAGTGIANAGNITDEETLDAWSNTACAFLNFYPANHVLAGGADDEPSPLSMEDWASACLRYVDPASTLGKALADDPASVAAPLGFYEAASVVRGTEVTEAATGGINVTVTLEGTQQDWQHTLTFDEGFLVQFNNDGLITDVVSLGVIGVQE